MPLKELDFSLNTDLSRSITSSGKSPQALMPCPQGAGQQGLPAVASVPRMGHCVCLCVSLADCDLPKAQEYVFISITIPIPSTYQRA